MTILILNRTPNLKRLIAPLLLRPLLLSEPGHLRAQGDTNVLTTINHFKIGARMERRMVITRARANFEKVDCGKHICVAPGPESL